MADVDKIKEILKKKYPNPKIELNFSNPFELLIATILSAQAQDVRVNKVTENLFKKLKTPEDYVNLGEDNLAEEIKSINYYKNKAKNIIKCCEILAKKYNNKVPETLEELVELPGIGRKTANVILGLGFNKPVIIVDTHVKRVSKRLGLTNENDPQKIEFDLMEKIPKNYWTEFSLAAILHGRYTCKARKPNCGNCVFNEICDKNV